MTDGRSGVGRRVTGSSTEVRHQQWMEHSVPELSPQLSPPRRRRRAGIILLAVGTATLAVLAALSAIEGNRALFQCASPIFALCVTLALILLTLPPCKSRRDG